MLKYEVSFRKDLTIRDLFDKTQIIFLFNEEEFADHKVFKETYNEAQELSLDNLKALRNDLANELMTDTTYLDLTKALYAIHLLIKQKTEDYRLKNPTHLKLIEKYKKKGRYNAS